jgi:hypothetical protein
MMIILSCKTKVCMKPPNKETEAIQTSTTRKTRGLEYVSSGFPEFQPYILGTEERGRKRYEKRREKKRS